MCIGTKRKSYTEGKGSKAPHLVYVDRTYFIVLTYLCGYAYCLKGVSSSFRTRTLKIQGQGG